MASTSPAVQERDVGIHEYVRRDVAGIGGRLKVEPSDFRVNELRVDGSEVRLDIDDERAACAEADGDGDSGESSDENERLVLFTLRKERQDTLGAIGVLSQLLGAPPRAFSIAGLKDHRAVTTQEVCVRGVRASRVRALELNPGAHIAIGHVRPTDARLKLGGCGGNRFRIVLRGASGADAADAALVALRDHGFVNYYGLQRFGGGAARNDTVGRCVLNAHYEQAVEALLRGPERTANTTARRASGAEAEARDVWAQARDAKTALRLMPRTCVVERDILRHVAATADAPMSAEARSRRAFLSLPLAQARLVVVVVGGP